jgi:hypothetical protein
MVGTAKGFGFSFRFRHHGGSVVAADIEESAKNAVIASHDEYRFTRQVASDVLTRLANLIGAPNHLPRACENCASF